MYVGNGKPMVVRQQPLVKAVAIPVEQDKQTQQQVLVLLLTQVQALMEQ
jgi:hypothetical protein